MSTSADMRHTQRNDERLWSVRIALGVATILVAGSGWGFANPLLAETAELRIDVANRTGPILHGASGWLYGQAAPSIPTVNMMEPLHPQISAQKPAGGLQHPAGDASLVAPDYRSAGGKLMQVYMQDIYPDWTYNDLGIEDYLVKVAAITRQVVADPNHRLFVYVPFNEPNNNWYSDEGPKFQKFLQDWARVYRTIRALDPQAKIAGPGFEHFNGPAFETFLTFARDHQVLPDEFTWHELHDDFFPEWYRRVDMYRASEKRLGIASLPIVINEYARDKGDLAVPGELVQWITRLENSKVYGCLAFWTPAGTLADLTARIWPNRPTGAWWLYAWYGSMTGQTVQVTPPDLNLPGLQGIATIDETKHQVRALFGGTALPMKLRFSGLDSRPEFKDGVHATLFRVRTSGVEPSPEPETIASRDYALSGSELALDIPASTADAAYSLVLTPRWSASQGDSPGEKRAVLADLRGKAAPVYAAQYGPSVSLSHEPGSSVRFLVSVDGDGYYRFSLRYAATGASASKGVWVSMKLNDERAQQLALAPNTIRPWAENSFRVFLAAGVNRFAFSEPPGSGALAIHSLRVEPTEGQITVYEAKSSANTLDRTAHKMDAEGIPGRQAVDGSGSGEASYLQFDSVIASTPGRYEVIATYSNDEKGHSGQVEEISYVAVNGRPATTVWFRNTFSAAVFATKVFPVDLKAGKNTIRFGNRSGRIPTIERIQIAKDLVQKPGQE